MERPSPAAGMNVDPAELSRFAGQAGDWWDDNGSFRPLHAMNPPRLRYVAERAGLEGRAVLDAGCGGGLLSEAMAERGARVTGIDAGAEAIAAAEAHARARGLDLAYHVDTLEHFAAAHPSSFDVVTCMELLEHVPLPASILRAAAQVLRPCGDLVVSTINRTPQAYLAAIVGAERVARILPRGTHDYARFIRPSELGRWMREAGFEVLDVTGMIYLPWLNKCVLAPAVGVNYLVHARKGDR